MPDALILSSVCRYEPTGVAKGGIGFVSPYGTRIDDVPDMGPLSSFHYVLVKLSLLIIVAYRHKI